MDSARDKHTGEIIDAEQLWDIAIVDKDAYECPGCGIQVFPASYKKRINKRRPYFTPMENKHIQPCGVDGFEKMVKKARIEQVGRPDGFPAPFPNRLIFTEDRPVTTGPGTPSTGSDTRAGSRTNGHSVAIYHGHTVKTIRPICRVFMDFPHDRDRLPLSIPGVHGTTYGTVFRKLGYFGIERQQPSTRLFCAPLRWVQSAESPDYIEWTLDAGEWPKGLPKDQNRPTKFYKVRVMWHGWTDKQRDTLQTEIEIARDQVKGTAGAAEKAWLFFIGTQDPDDAEVFVVDRYPFICCRVGEMLRSTR